MTFALALAGCLAFEMPFVALERAATSSTATGRYTLYRPFPDRMNVDKLSDEIPGIFAAKLKNVKRSRNNRQLVEEEEGAPLREQASISV